MTAKFGEWKTATYGEPMDLKITKANWERAIKSIHTKQPKTKSSAKKRLPSRRQAI
jgi:histone H3/H4